MLVAPICLPPLPDLPVSPSALSPPSHPIAFSRLYPTGVVYFTPPPPPAALSSPSRLVSDAGCSPSASRCSPAQIRLPRPRRPTLGGSCSAHPSLSLTAASSSAAVAPASSPSVVPSSPPAALCIHNPTSRGQSGAGPASSGLANYFPTFSNSQRLAGKVAVITGAANGIGKATATEFVRNGAKVILTDIHHDLCRDIAADLGPNAEHAGCDVTDEAQIAAAVDLAVARHGRLDILYSNAGVSGSITASSVPCIDLADFDRTMALNARSVIASVKQAARVMVPQRSGCILCTASTAGVLGDMAMPPVYSISKAAVIGVVRAVAGELGRHGVRVNAISPHGIATQFVLRVLAQMYPKASLEELKLMAERDMNEMAEVVPGVEDVARAAVYLASAEAKYVNGHNLMVDGGFTVGKRPNITAVGKAV